MWIVKLALRRPYTFVAAAILIAILGGIAISRMPTDILPDIDIPVVSAIWQYKGLSADEMDKRVTTLSERTLTTTVSDIEHIESQSLTGLGVIKVFFHPGTPVEAAVAQMTAISQTVTRQMPAGITPPLIIRFNASSVPILQLGMGGRGLSEQALYDIGANFLRTQLATVQGASVLMPSGGKARQVMVDLDPKALYARGLSPSDVSAAINAQSPIVPTGNFELSAIMGVTRFPDILSFDVYLPVYISRRKRSRVTSSDRRSESSDFRNGPDVSDRGSITGAPSRLLLRTHRECFWNTRVAFAMTPRPRLM